jgi:3-hydroxybutyryl-CoA dehydratase
MVDKAEDSHSKGETPVALGYDRIRFVGPVFFGDTVTLTYKITSIDEVRRRSNAEITVVNQRGETVASAIGILKWVKVHSSGGSKNA